MACSLICYARRIRRAYKRKALELHPDRNFNDVENATKKFAEVQTAYEILSDPQERAWYDSHRDAILGGDADSVDLGSTDQSPSRYTPANKIFDLMGRFSSSIPMNDSPSGFFGNLNLFFDQLAMEEADASDRSGRDDPVRYPAFGLAKDDYDTIAKPFYQVWSSFSTSKTFGWRDKYRLSDAPDRRVRRLMEKENRKFREEGIREFNDAVLSLVAFVKKRDPRYVPNTQSEAERQQVLRSSAAAQAARSRAANQEKLSEFIVPDWVQSRGDDLHHGEFSESEEESEVEQIECIVCNKTFKSEKQFEVHAKSKKHLKAVQQLQWQMRKENASFAFEYGESREPSKAAAAGELDDDLASDGEERTDEYSEPGQLASGRGNEEVRRSQAASESQEQNPKDGDSTESTDDEYASRAKVESRLFPADKLTESAKGSAGHENDESSLPVIDSLMIEDNQSGGKKIGKAKQKREKKAARQAAGQQNMVRLLYVP